jgi:hypothetical protein
MVNATDCRSVSWGFDSLPRLYQIFGVHVGRRVSSGAEEFVIGTRNRHIPGRESARYRRIATPWSSICPKPVRAGFPTVSTRLGQ